LLSKVLAQPRKAVSEIDLVGPLDTNNQYKQHPLRYSGDLSMALHESNSVDGHTRLYL